MSDLLIKISADVKDVTKAYDDVRKQTEDLEGSLDKVAKVSAVAFAALTGEIALSIKAFTDSDTATRKLNDALQSQGIFTEELSAKYKEYADAVSETTGISDIQITQSQAVAQTYLGQIPITKDLTKAIADLAVKQGTSLPQAAEELGKAIGNGTGMLLRQGLQFAATDTEADRYSKTLSFIKIFAGDASTAISPLILATKQLGDAFEKGEIAIGEKFAPALTSVINLITEWITPAKEGAEETTNLKAALLAAGVAVTALGVALPLLAQGFLVVRAAAIALQIGAAPLLLIPAAIAAITFVVVELALHWETASAKITQVVKAMVEFVSGAFKGLASVIQGAFLLDVDKIKDGLKQIQDAFKSSVTTATAEIPKETEKALTQQEEVRKKFADKQAAQKKEQDASRIALAKAEHEAILLDLQDASAEQIALKKKEIETLKALEASREPEERALLKQRLTKIRQDEKEQQKLELDQDAEFQKEDIAARSRYGNDKVKITSDADKKEIAAIRRDTLTKETAQNKVYKDELKEQQKAHNTFLEEQIKYGIAYATINELIHSKEVEGINQATGELVALQNSRNATLKEIGKIAAISQIVIKTAQSAMNIYEGFSTIPIIGPALGIAGAAAAIAYGAEQVQNVNAAQQGALVEGGVQGRDSVPFLLEPGELVVPKQNFNDVVTGYAKQQGLSDNQNGNGSGQVNVVIGFDGRDAQQVLTARRLEDQALGTYRSRT